MNNFYYIANMITCVDMIKIALRSGCIVLENGGETYRTEETIVHVAKALGASFIFHKRGCRNQPRRKAKKLLQTLIPKAIGDENMGYSVKKRVFFCLYSIFCGEIITFCTFFMGQKLPCVNFISTFACISKQK